MPLVFIPSCPCINITIGMHQMNTKETYGEKAIYMGTAQECCELS